MINPIIDEINVNIWILLILIFSINFNIKRCTASITIKLAPVFSFVQPANNPNIERTNIWILLYFLFSFKLINIKIYKSAITDVHK